MDPSEVRCNFAKNGWTYLGTFLLQLLSRARFRKILLNGLGCMHGRFCVCMPVLALASMYLRRSPCASAGVYAGRKVGNS